MAERRKVSLLDCAIAASAAVVPVLIGVVVLVAVVRPADPDAAWRQGRDDRYVSVRYVAALQTFERAIARRQSLAPTTIDAAQVLDGVAGCRREWGVPNGPLPWLRRAVLGGAPETAPADEIAARLNELDAALLRFSGRSNPRVEHRVGFDAARWFGAVRDALATPVATGDASGRQFQLRCADLAGALAALRRGDGAMLESLAWRGSEGSATLARWRPDQEMQVSARDVTRRNPWGGAAGCIYLGGQRDDAATTPRYFLAGARSLQRRLCATPALSGVAAAASGSAGAAPIVLAGEPGADAAADDPRWRVPPSLLTLLQPLESLRQPTGAFYRLYTEGEGANDALERPARPRASANRAALDGAALDVGYSIDVTIDPALQALAQKTAACYTGRSDICRALAMHRKEDGDAPPGQQLLEGAMVRMAAVAVIDVASGRIEALAGALSRCARQEVDGPGRDGGCDPRLPYPSRYRGDALLNQAVFHDAMPASTIKPIMATAFLADPRGGARLLAVERAAMQRDGVPARDSLRGQLMRSDSARFLDRMFCSDSSFAACHRPWEVQAAALAFGWNADCAEGRESCGKIDLLFGRPVDAGAARGALAPGPTAVAYGRLLSEPAGHQLGAPMHLMPATTLDAGILRRCAAGPDGRRMSDDDWERCRGGAVVDVVAEGWGQGHARASALGVAGMMATVAAAANGAVVVPRPHLIESVHGVAAPATIDRVRADALGWGAPPLAAPLARDAAEVVLSGLSYSHRAGTARTACEQVFDARGCRTIDWLAGKTGTPSFPSDGLSLDAIAGLCGDGHAAPADVKRGICGALRPYKWYVAAWRGDRSAHGPWTKAIAVLTERNWLRASGRVHGAGDTGPNPSAEIALQIVGRTTGLIEGGTP
jgi:hypothetical protein